MNVARDAVLHAFSAEPDIAAWAHSVPLNPARIPADHPGSAELYSGPRAARGRHGALARGDCAADGDRLSGPRRSPEIVEDPSHQVTLASGDCCNA